MRLPGKNAEQSYGREEWTRVNFGISTDVILHLTGCVIKEMHAGWDRKRIKD